MTAFLYTLILAGFIQGIIMGGLLFFSGKRTVSNRLLALVVWLIALPGIHLYAHYQHFFDGSSSTDFIHALVPWIMIMAIGPLILFYVRSIFEQTFSFRKKDWLHFLPVLIDLFPKLVELAFIAGMLSPLISDRPSMVKFIDSYNLYADIPRWISFAYYIYVSGQYIRQRTAGKEKQQPVNWLRSFILAMRVFVIIWFIYLIPYLIPASSRWLSQTVGWFPVYIPLSVMIYWVGISGYRFSLSQSAAKPERPVDGSAYSSELLDQTSTALVKSMESERLYLDPLLDLPRLSDATGISAKLISAALNQYLNKGFSQFINEYRVAEFKKRVVQPESGHLTLTGLALACGFSSPATFQRIFKQLTGITPTEYKKGMTANTAEKP